MKEKNDKLTAKEKRFCVMFVQGGNAKDAARAAGYTDPEKAAAALMLRADIAQQITEQFEARAKNCHRLALAGYERLAFGNVSDAVKLMFEDDPLGAGLERYDLFNVSEIKRPKEGAMEIKFFDRIRALEKLEGASDDQENKLSGFYSALMGSKKEEDGS